MKNKVCVVTAARSEYGLLRWVIDEIQQNKELQLQLIVTGSHLSPEYGNTYQEIERDGYYIDEKIEILLSTSTMSGIAKSIGICSIALSDVLSRLSPDIILVLGDRYELLSICSTALVMRIPIAHIAGGEVTEGAIDDQIRNAVTMMSTLHFPGIEEARNRILSMGILSDSVLQVGELSIENSQKIAVLSKAELSEILKITDINRDKKWVLFTFHTETKIELSKNIEVFKLLLDLLLHREDVFVIASYSNADHGGVELNKILEGAAVSHRGNNILVSKNLGQKLYCNLLRNASAMVGNSSSGIYESQIAQLPVLNIGNRQKGRPRTPNILDCSLDLMQIKESINKVLCMKETVDFSSIENIYGDGNTSSKIVDFILQYFKKDCNNE